MRLLESRETADGGFRWAVYRDTPPPYAILSHTWGSDDDEVAFQDLVSDAGPADKPGWAKLRFCASQARQDGLDYFWIDTCCINKQDTNELSRSINSMFRWYQNAERCYVYLSHFTMTRRNVEWEAAFRAHRWFTRGWTLQELVAPQSVEFFNEEGRRLGDKRTLETLIHEITGVAVLALQGKPLANFSAEERFSWADTRQTKEEEDWAYSLLGIFDVSMALIYGEGREKAVRRLKAEISAGSRPVDVVPERPAVWLVPFDRNGSFTGRDAELLDLKRKVLAPHESTSRLAITGLGGVGKTQLILEFLHQTRLELRQHLVIWIQATSKESLEQGFLSAATQLGLAAGESKNAKELVRDHLSREAAGKWLLIFDNADDISMWMDPAVGNSTRLLDLLPRSREGSIIFTTRDGKAAVKFAGRHIVRVSSMDELSSIHLLAGHVTDQSLLTEHREDAVALVSRLAHLPLAIVQAAKYMESNGISPQGYLSLMEVQEESFIRLLSEDFEVDARYSDIKNPVATTWLISFRQIQDNHQLAAEYLAFMSCVDSKDIPLSMLPPGRSPKEQMDAIGTLQAYSFVTKQADNSTITLHRLVHLVTRSWVRQDRQLSSTVKLATDRLAKLLFRPDRGKRAAWRSYMPHASYLLDNGALEHMSHTDDEPIEHGGKKETAPADSLKSWTRKLATRLARPHRVTRKLRSVLNNSTDSADFPQELSLLYSYSDCLVFEGRYPEAEARVRTLWEFVKSKYGPDHENTLQCHSRLAYIYRIQGRWKEAEILQLQVLQTMRKVLGAEHASTLISLDNLALTYYDQGRREEARSLQEQVLKMRQKVLGEEHPDTLIAMGNLASIAWTQGRWDEAEVLEAKVLTLRRQVLGEEHPDTFMSLGNLASIYSNQGRWEQAEALEVQALKMSQQVLGEEHPSTLVCMNNLALTLYKQGRLDEAEDLGVQALNTSRQVLGAGHPSTLGCMANLAFTWQGLDRREDALALMQDCVRLTASELGEDYPVTEERRNILRSFIESPAESNAQRPALEPS